MKAVTQFVCELCGNRFNDAERALACEKKHVRIEELTDVRYSGKYPRIIYAQAEDGESLKYVRDDFD